MEIVSGEQMRRIDRRAIDDFGIPSLSLMEAAGREVARALLEDVPDAATRGVVVVCGKGNNGGDGLVAARWLGERGPRPLVLLIGRPEELSADAMVQLERARGAGIEVREVPDEAAWERNRSVLDGRPLVVDALLGTGARGGARGLAAHVIESLNRSDAVRVSIDLPSGLDADRGEVAGATIVAHRTYTLCRPKRALVLEPAASRAGRWRTLDIGIPDAAVEAEACTMRWLDAGEVRSLLGPRAVDSHKGTWGHLLIVAGSRGKSGAAVLAARGALRAGVGLVTAAVPVSIQATVAAQQAELMTEALPEAPVGEIAAEAAATVLDLAGSRSALAIGPGLGSGPAVRGALGAILDRCTKPCVLDADALNGLRLGSRPLAPGPGGASRPWVLTPHPGEAARLLGSTAADVQRDRLACALRLASETRCVVVLKGARTLVCAPDGRVAVNSTGNPGMGTAGTGDVLTGIVGALLARGLDPWDAARLSVFAHGDAGDRAAAELGVWGMIASDLARHLPAAWTALGAPSGAGSP